MADIKENRQLGILSTGAVKPSLDVLQVSLDAGGCVRTANLSALNLFSTLTGELTGKNFHHLLLELNPAWEVLLPSTWKDGDGGSVFLPWDQDDQPGLGWNILTLPVDLDRDAGLTVSLVPGIAPDISAFAMQEGLDGPLGPALHSLFFRTRQVEARFRQFLRLLPGVPYTQDLNLLFSYRNEQLRSLLGKSFSKVENGQDWVDWIHPEDRVDFDRSLERTLSHHAPAATRFRLCLEEDRVIYILDLRIPVRSLSGQVTGYEGLWLDLTRQTIAEKRLQRAAWKESLAEVTSSLSHDFNNTLTGIVNLSDLMCTGDFGEDALDIYRKDMEIIHSSAKQAQHLIQRIVSLNRESVGEIGLHNLVEIVRQQQDLIRIILPTNIEFSVDLPAVEIPVRIDPSAIRRILLNFSTNARDAVDPRGKVQIYLSIVDLSDYPRDYLFSSRCGQSGSAAELLFRDNGSGIDPKILHRIFGPYFSTKETTRGSGLGLYSMTQFARENGFDFGVRSKLGEGTDMLLLIPIEDLRASEAPIPADRSPVRKLPENSPLEMRVAVYAELDNSIMHLVRELLSAGIHVEIIEDPEAACEWLADEASEGDVFFKLMDHRKQCPKEVLDHLRKADLKVQRFLCVRGFNPDEISHLDGDAFDVIFEEHAHPGENMKILVQQSAKSPERSVFS